MTSSIEEVLKKHFVKIRSMARWMSRGYGGVQNEDDLEAAGWVAVWQCYQRFDTRRLPEAEFWAFALSRVRGAMLDHLRQIDSLGRHGRGLIKNEKTDKFPWAAFHRVSLSTARHVSFDADPLEALLKKDQAVEVAELLARLPPRHQQVIRMYFLEGLTLIKIGNQLKVSEGRASQLKQQALALLRETVERE